MEGDGEGMGIIVSYGFIRVRARRVAVVEVPAKYWSWKVHPFPDHH